MKYKVIFIFSELYCTGLLISGIIRNGFPTDIVFWIASAIEIAIGLMTYYAYSRSLTQKSYKLWSFLFILLFTIGIVSPIVLYNTVDSLKALGSTWIIFAFTGNSCILYRIIRKQPISRQDILSGNI